MNFRDTFNDWFCLFEDEHHRELTEEECHAFASEYFKDFTHWMESLKKISVTISDKPD